MTNWLVPMGAALIGGMSGGLLAPWAKARFDRHHQRHLAFDRTIAAVKAVLYAYTAPTDVDRSEIGNSSYSQDFLDQLRPRRMERFFDATYAMRQAIAELEPHYKVVWDRERFQLDEQELTRLVDQLKKAR
ncbi:hypothetical protein ACFV8Z_26425 [Streptomyces sp. NPDC059837]|uniref:hypothetical protein n=1 Tax=unclassified Streptomyces TaxID=2593676 RepID=UPI002257DD15|nr:hypothetical protein [Streptomyces sp. NBC_00365]MCX5089983.1 hypothetical protein [Streptomyces sp. NBC_00365]